MAVVESSRISLLMVEHAVCRGAWYVSCGVAVIAKTAHMASGRKPRYEIPGVVEPRFMGTDAEPALRAYAAGQISWSLLRDRHFGNYLDVLGGLGPPGPG